MAKKGRASGSRSKAAAAKTSVTCTVCGKSFGFQRYLKRHMQSVHRANKPVKNTSDFDCSMCGKTFRYLSHLQRHQLTHLEMREHACPLCKQTFVQKDHLKRHLAAKHSDGQSTKQFPCPRCQREKAFPTQWELQRHLDSVHPTLLTCTQCDDSFIFETQEAWQSHKETHTGRRQFQCDRCGRGFHQRCDLDAHTAAHDRLGRFQCVACELAFVQRVQVDRHLRKCHLPKNGNPSCRTCHESFDSERALTGHLKAEHQYASSQMCRYCYDVFPSANAVASHIHDAHFRKATPIEIGGMQDKDDFHSLTVEGHFTVKRLDEPVSIGMQSPAMTSRENDDDEQKKGLEVESEEDEDEETSASLRLIVVVDESCSRPPATLDLAERLPPELVSLFPGLRGLQVTPEDGVTPGQTLILTFPVQSDALNDSEARLHLAQPITIHYS